MESNFQRFRQECHRQMELNLLIFQHLEQNEATIPCGAQHSRLENQHTSNQPVFGEIA